MADDTTVVYPLVSGDGNERVLEEWLTDHASYALADTDRPVDATDAELCITDKGGLRRHGDALAAIKAETEPVLFPVLLLLSERDTDLIETDEGGIVDNVLISTVDEIVALPIRQAELEWRIEALLRLREQSLELRAQTEQLRRFREAVEASGHAIFVTDTDGVIEYANPAFEEITGYDRTAIVGETPNVLQSGAMSAGYYEEMWETITAGDTWTSEVVDRRKDGTPYTAYQTIAPIVDDDGDVSAFVAVQTDISERKALQDRLKRHRDIVQRLDDPIMIQDESGAFELLNEALVEFAGRPKPELLGNSEPSFMDEATAETIDEKRREVMATESPVRYSVAPEFEHSDREAVFSTSRYPYYDDDGALSGTIAICRDVTELEERTRQLRVMDNILRHNLRNDLMVVRGLAEQVRSEAPAAAPLADKIIDHTEKLMSTGEKSRAITDLLSSEPRTRPLDVAVSVGSLVEELSTAASGATIATDLPEHATADVSINFSEAVEELLRNAIEHSDREAPSVELRVETTDDAVAVTVVDDGPGMPEMDRDVLETGLAIDDLYHGSGLGLWLVYWVVRRSGGSIEVAEADPRGTEITITVPRSERGAGEADQPGETDAGDRPREPTG